MIRKLLKKAGKKLVGNSPRIPAAAPTKAATHRPAPPPHKPPAPETTATDAAASSSEPDVEVDAAKLEAWVNEGKKPLFVDIREPQEMGSGVVEGAAVMPMNTVPQRLKELPQDRPLVIYCAAGMRSYSVTHFLREQGVSNSWSLIDGVGAWLGTGAKAMQPPTGSPFSIAQTVTHTADGQNAVGTVEAIYKDGEKWRFSLRVASKGGGSQVLVDLSPDDLKRT